MTGRRSSPTRTSRCWRWITADRDTGAVEAAWYTHRFDPIFHNRQDVELARLSRSGRVLKRSRGRAISNETAADPKRRPVAGRTGRLDIGKAPPAADAHCEARGASRRFAGDRRCAQATFVPEGLVEREVPLLVGRLAVGSHADLREARDVVGEALRFLARLALRDHAVAEAHGARLLGTHRSPGQDQIQRMAHSDQPRETDGSAVAQRDAPSPAEHPELGILLHHPKVAQERELEAPGDRVAVDRGDGGLPERPASRAERPVAIGLIELLQGALGDRLEVVAGAERLALSAQDRDRRLGIVVERLERVLELEGGGMVD